MALQIQLSDNALDYFTVVIMKNCHDIKKVIIPIIELMDDNQSVTLKRILPKKIIINSVFK